MFNTKVFIAVVTVLLLLSLGVNFYLYKSLQSCGNDLEQISNTDDTIFSNDKMQQFLSCNEFQWTEKYVEVIEGDIPWVRCNEGSSRCAFWEDYQGNNPLPKVKIKGCFQEGTRLEDGKVATGLPEGEYFIQGATIRPCTADEQFE